MQKNEVRQLIADTVHRWCGASANPAALIRIAERESALTPHAIGDKTKAPPVFLKQQERIRKEGNPWWNDPARWGGSFGLYQLMAPYMVRIWNPKADPYVLFRPDVSTIVAGRLWNRAIRLGARNFVDVRMVWAYGGERGLEFAKDSDEYLKRVNDKWSVVEGIRNPPASMFAYAGFGTDPIANQEQYLTSQIPEASNASWLLPAIVGAATFFAIRRRAA